MSPLTQRRLAVANCLLVTAFLAAAAVLGGLSVLEDHLYADYAANMVITLVILLIAGLGALIVVRHPGHLIGIGMVLTGLAVSLTGLSEAYAQYGIVTFPGSLPATRIAAWADAWVWVLAILPAVTLLLLVFPEGTLLTRRWRYALWLDVTAIMSLVLGQALRPGPFEDFPEVVNPFGLSGAFEALGFAGFILLIPSIMISTAGLILRFRRSAGRERQQLKWVASAGAFAAIIFVASWGLAVVYPFVWNYSGAIMFVPLPVTMAIAILRDRLYEIDRILNRSLAYGLLTALLVVTYFGLVVGLQAASKPVSGGSDLAVALTTLIVAALFLPARRRVQQLVDRRFNRRAYDAAKTIEAFGARLRQNIDLDTLRYELLTVVDETMQPASVSLWLRSNQ